MTNTSRLVSRLVILLRAAVGALMVSAVLLNFANVIGRYVFARPFIWAEEVMQFLNVWAVMLGAAVITRDRTHLRMDAFYTLLSRPARRAVDAFINLLAVAVSAYVIVQSLAMIRMLALTGQRSVIARLPMAVIYLSVPLGFALGGYFVVLWFHRLFRGELAKGPVQPDRPLEPV
ncbi:MAG: TRAP transporter small permease [Deltaproteobacteria bacterium]|nr:TRAP transporter small permease [Deltaproteobacteria bacterium]